MYNYHTQSSKAPQVAWGPSPSHPGAPFCPLCTFCTFLLFSVNFCKNYIFPGYFLYVLHISAHFWTFLNNSARCCKFLHISVHSCTISAHFCTFLHSPAHFCTFWCGADQALAFPEIPEFIFSRSGNPGFPSGPKMFAADPGGIPGNHFGDHWNPQGSFADPWGSLGFWPSPEHCAKYNAHMGWPGPQLMLGSFQKCLGLFPGLWPSRARAFCDLGAPGLRLWAGNSQLA